jgi:LAO/AO transport system kinase
LKQLNLPGKVNDLLDQVVQKQLNPYTAAHAILEYDTENQTAK